MVGKEEVDGLALVEGLLHPAVALRDFDANPLEGSDQARPVDLFDLANAIKEKIDIFTRTVLVERAASEGDMGPIFGRNFFDLPAERDGVIERPGERGRSFVRSEGRRVGKEGGRTCNTRG